MLEKIIVKGLFQRFDYDIELKSGGITILTGPNGFGKSTVLKMIEMTCRKDFNFLKDMPFDSFMLSGGNCEVKVRKDGDKIYLNDLLLKFVNTELKLTKEEMREYEKISAEMAESFGEVKYLKEQRPLNEWEMYGLGDRKDGVNEIPDKIKDKINEAIIEYSKISQKLDGEFPSALKAESELSEEQFKKYTEKIKSIGDKLSKYGIGEKVKKGSYSEKYGVILKLFLGNEVKKLCVYDDLLEKFEIFLKSVNEKLQFKRAVISLDCGMKIIDEISGDVIDLSKLSSGERQIISMYYQMIFETQWKGLLLLDEPEISLHIAWQMNFIEDLRKIPSVRSGNIQVIIATHSPQLINDNFDLQIDLGECYGS